VALLIDSSVFIALERRGQDPGALVTIAPDQDIAIASITASELLIGVHRSDSPERRVRREAFVEAVLQLAPTVPFDLRVARTHAQLWAALMAAGQQIGSHDQLIAATALAHGYAVLTENLREFQRVPGLVVRQPTW
jgi:predicted nucleic acid-binding protein